MWQFGRINLHSSSSQSKHSDVSILSFPAPLRVNRSVSIRSMLRKTSHLNRTSIPSMSISSGSSTVSTLLYRIQFSFWILNSIIIRSQQTSNVLSSPQFKQKKGVYSCWFSGCVSRLKVHRLTANVNLMLNILRRYCWRTHFRTWIWSRSERSIGHRSIFHGYCSK